MLKRTSCLVGPEAASLVIPRRRAANTIAPEAPTERGKMCVPFARSLQTLCTGSGDDTWVQPQHRKQVKRVRFVSTQVH